MYALDASALIRFIDNEAGADRVASILREARAGVARVEMSVIHWGEVVLIILKRYGPDQLHFHLAKLRRLPISLITVNVQRAERNAHVRRKYNIPHADAFGVELASDSPDHILVTADFDVKPAESDISIEFLPTKPKP